MIPDHTVTDERMRWHEEQARKLQSAEAQVVLRREAHAAFLAAEATATAAEARGAKEAHRLAQEDEHLDSDVVNAVAGEADLASEAASGARCGGRRQARGRGAVGCRGEGGGSAGEDRWRVGGRDRAACQAGWQRPDRSR